MGASVWNIQPDITLVAFTSYITTALVPQQF